jgi:hypothetical protein
MKDIMALMTDLVGFYPKHIAKEDKGFFKPVMKYFTKAELDAMLNEEYEFDKGFIHRLYGDIVSAIESKT